MALTRGDAGRRLAVRSGRSKDLEIIVLGHQLGVLRRQIGRPALDNDDPSLLGAIAAALPRLRRHGWLVTPDTLLRWHRRRIARHLTQPHRPPGTTSHLRRGVRQLILAMAADDPNWGYRRIHGELAGIGQRIAASTIWQILRTAGIDPAPDRSDITWIQFLRSHAARNLLLRHGHQLTDARALVRDCGSQFIDTFDEIFRTEGLKILKTEAPRS